MKKEKSISASIGTLIIMLIANQYWKLSGFEFFIGYMVTEIYLRKILPE